MKNRTYILVSAIFVIGLILSACKAPQPATQPPVTPPSSTVTQKLTEATNNQTIGSQTVEKPTMAEESKENLGSDNVNIKVKVPRVVETVDCDTQNCFQEKFVACSPATLKADTGFAAVQYKITGSAANGCNVAFQYTTNPNPDWVNKEMTCTLDNKLDFEKSFQNAFTGVMNDTVVCEGPLYTVLQAI